MLTLEHLKQILNYDPITGLWTWLKTNSNSRIKGKVAGGIQKSTGYRRIRIDKKEYKAHILAWFYITGEWPVKDIDHKNTIKSDNRWLNLRLATESQNLGNSNISKLNKTGFKGVRWSKWHKKYQAQINVNGKKFHLGYTDKPEEASLLYKIAANKEFGEFARY